MRTDYAHCEYCGRVIPTGELFCEVCRKKDAAVAHDPDSIFDPEFDPLPHHELPETDQKPPSLKRAGEYGAK